MARTIERPSPLPEGTAVPVREPSTDLVEPVEDPGKVLHWNAGPAVFHRQADAARDWRRCQLNGSAVRGVADGVGGEVLNHLLEALRIAADLLGAGRDAPFQRDVLGPQRGIVAMKHALEERRYGDGLVLPGSGPALEPRQIQQVANDVLHALGFIDHDAEVTLARGIVETQVGHRHRFGVPADGGERRHELVGNIGEQLPP
jgi:hypothetical protein